MQIIELDATKWKKVSDFYDALLTSIGAPNGHGRNPDALIDSMIWGGINAVEPPYTVRISGLSATPKEVHDHVELVRDMLVEGRIYRKRHNGDDVEVSIVNAPANDGSMSDDQVTKIRDAVEAVQYEGPDPKLRTIADNLRRQLKPGALLRMMR
jgi:RNAse (barnase) inhibitor barstar